MPLVHNHQPIQYGAEREFCDRVTATGDIFDPTEAEWDPQVYARVVAQGTQGLVDDQFASVRPENAAWDQLSDLGKTAYVLAYKDVHGKYPRIVIDQAAADIAKVDFEPEGLEVVSGVFDNPADAARWVNKYGSGHFNISFALGDPADTKQQIRTWLTNANLYVFFSCFERRPDGPGDQNLWPFRIVALSVPTEQHLDIYSEELDGDPFKATAFSKHVLVGLRAVIYGPDRVGFEVRGGVQSERERVIDSALAGLTEGSWCSLGDNGDFRLCQVRDTSRQPKGLPDDFQQRLARHLDGAQLPGLGSADAARLTRTMAAARFFEGERSSSMNAFDQRGAIPLMDYEQLPWLTAGERAKVGRARNAFLQELDKLSRRHEAGQIDAVALGTELADRLGDFMRSSDLADAFGRWLDAGRRSRLFSAA